MKFTFDDALIAFSEDELRSNAPLAEAAFQTAVQKSGRGNDFLGWIDLPAEISNEDLDNRYDDIFNH